MIFIYDDDKPVVLRARINGKDGVRVHPKGDDDGELLFESYESFQDWLTAVALAAGESPSDLQHYDDWEEEN